MAAWHIFLMNLSINALEVPLHVRFLRPKKSYAAVEVTTPGRVRKNGCGSTQSDGFCFGKVDETINIISISG